MRKDKRKVGEDKRNELDKKLKVLSDIAYVLNKNHVVWAVDGSLLLYFKGKTDLFHDIDLMSVMIILSC